jgi:hypothetical protein
MRRAAPRAEPWRRLAWLLPLAALPLLLVGLWLWTRQGELVWLTSFLSYCF